MARYDICPVCGQLDIDGCGCVDNPAPPFDPWKGKLVPVADPEDPDDGRHGYDDDAFEPSDSLTDDQWRRR